MKHQYSRFISLTPLGLDLQAHPVYLRYIYIDIKNRHCYKLFANIFRFLLMFQFFHPISTTGILPFLLLTILNFRIYRRYVVIVGFLRIRMIWMIARKLFHLFYFLKKGNYETQNYCHRWKLKTNQIEFHFFFAESHPMDFLSFTKRTSIWQESSSPL